MTVTAAVSTWKSHTKPDQAGCGLRSTGPRTLWSALRVLRPAALLRRVLLVATLLGVLLPALRLGARLLARTPQSTKELFLRTLAPCLEPDWCAAVRLAGVGDEQPRAEGARPQGHGAGA